MHKDSRKLIWNQNNSGYKKAVVKKFTTALMDINLLKN